MSLVVPPRKRAVPRLLTFAALVVCTSIWAAGWPGAALADDDDNKARKGFDFGQGGKGKKGTPKKGGPRDGDAPAPGTTDPIEQEIQKLRGWPGRKATRAAEQLFVLQKQAVPYLVRALDSGDPAVQPGAAWVLGEVGEEAHVPVLLRAAARRENASRADVFFKAAYALGAKPTKRWLISFLTVANRPVFRNMATDFLASKVGADDHDRVLLLLESDKSPVRIAGLKLLAPAGVADSEERLLQALSDLTPSVSYAAARLLASSAGESLIRRLNELARESGARERAYANITLVEIARAQSSNPFEGQTIVELTGRRGLLHPEKLSRGTAASSLAYGALESREENIANLLDGRVMDTLISTLGGSHFRDYGSVAPSVFAALRRLSGRDLPDTAVAWAKWWQTNRGSFRARRPLQKLEATDVPRAYVRFDAIEANGRRVLAEFVAAGGAERRGAYVLKGKVFEGLVAFLEGEGLFEFVERGGVRANEHVAVTLGVLNQRKRMTISAKLMGAGESDTQDNQRKYERLKMRMAALVDANLWQRYRDADQWPDAQAWWKTNVDLMGQAGPGERRAMLRASIVHAFDDLPDDVARADALARLQRMEGALTRTEAQLLAKQLTTRASFGRMEAEGLRWVIQQGHDEVREEIITAVAQRDEAEARTILAGMLLDGGVERIRSAFADERRTMRAGAAHATRLYVESGAPHKLAAKERERAFGRLRPGLEVLSLEKDAVVSIRALIALAYIGEIGIVDKLEKLYHGGNFNVKLEVTQALGYIPGRRSHEFLTRVMAEERKDGRSGALRAAALDSMARSSHKDAVRLLRYYLLNDRDPNVRDAAGRTLAKMGTDEARFAIVEHLTSGEPDPERRARLVGVLGEFRDEVVPVLLRRYLGDRDQRVRAIAALRAADHNMSEAFPFLLQILKRGEGRQREEALAGLEVLTSTRFGIKGYSAIAQRYGAWYEDPRIKGNSDRHWFREALKHKGYDVGPLAPYLNGKQDLGPVPLLIRVLRDDDNVIRRNASVALERLTGRRMARIDLSTSSTEAGQVADLWSRWLEQRRAKSSGGGR